MFRKSFFLAAIILTFFILHPSSTRADYPTDCALDYPVCYVNRPPGGEFGVCLNREVLHCTTSTGAQGNWCCPTVLPTVTPAPPTPTIIYSCVANGNYCIPNGEFCDPGHIRGQGGSCETGKVCCAVPVPTVPPGGGNPPPIPLPTYPTNFNALEYPCNKTTDEEFHPLRPYPASPCDPLIPAKSEPFPMSFACGKSLNTLGDYRVQRQFTQAELDNMQTTFQHYGEPYRCGNQVCIRKRSVFNITLDLGAAKLPVVGNTQDPLDDATKVNNYLSWYLTGTNPTWLDDLPQNTQTSTTNTQCIGNSLSIYMNTIITGTSDLENVKLTSPAFNLTNPIEQDIFTAMVDTNANFSQIDAFAGNTYTLNGVDAFDWVTSPNYRGGDGKTWFEKFTSFSKPIIFTEFGDFGTDNSPQLPNPPRVISNMKDEFFQTASNPSVKAINYFNAFGSNNSFPYHELLDPELTDIINGQYISKAGVNSAIGVDGSGQFHQHIDSINGNSPNGWSVELFFSPGDLSGVVAAANHAIEHHLTPIFRPCYGNNCDFSNPSVYVQFIRDVSAQVAASHPNGEIWFIAGPNEPAGESWASPQCTTAGVPTASVDRFLTYAGPIRKLLPQSALDIIRYTLKAYRNSDVHDYRLDTDNRRLSGIPPLHLFDPQSLWGKLFQRVPLATMEDTVGEVTVGLITTTRSDGTSPQPPDVFVGDPNSPDAMKLTISSADSRLYFPHLKTVTSLIEVLNAISRPKAVQNYYPDRRNTTEPIDQHQGFNPDQTPVQIAFGEGGWPDTTITRNTEVRENHPAPIATFGQNDHFEFDQRCDLTTLQMAEGDNLFGKTISGKLAYSNDLKFDPIIIPPNCGGGDLAGCANASDPTQGDFSQCCPLLATRCEDIDDTDTGYDWRCTGGGTNEQTIPTEARVGVFTKTPLIDAFYSNLISNKDAFFRRFINWYQTGGTDTTIRSGALTFPVKTQVGYTATGVTPLGTNETSPDNPHAGAGTNTGGAEIYFPRLGSLADYFLGSPTNERLNLQKMLRPKNFGSLVGPGGPGISQACEPYLSNFPGTISVTVQNPSNVFSKVGDSITVGNNNFLDPFAGSYTLGNHTDLQAAINFFTASSFSKDSYSACVGWNSNDLVIAPNCNYDNGRINNFCSGKNNPLTCEYDNQKPAVSLIMIGTNDSGGDNQVVVEAYKARLRTIITITKTQGIIPILSTLPHLTNHDHPQYDINTELLSQATKDVSVEMGVPLVDYRLATENLIGAAKNYGISSDNIHPSVASTGPGDLSDTALSEGGYNVRNFVSLCALDAIWKTRLGGGGSSTGVSCTYTNADAEAAYAQAASKYGVPVSMLRAVHDIESFPYDDTRGKTFECTNNSAMAAGPFQIVRKDSDIQNSTYHAVTCEAERITDSCDRTPGKLSRCNIYDSAELAARVLLSKVSKWNYAQCSDAGDISESNLPDVYNASCRYYGSFNPDSATDARGRDFPGLPPRSDGARYNYCDVVCGRMKQSNPSLNYCPGYPSQQAQ